MSGERITTLITERTMNSDRLTCIHLEVAINRSTTNPHDSAEDAALRAQVAADCAAVMAAAPILDGPGETS